jgi:hypothetical protein
MRLLVRYPPALRSDNQVTVFIKQIFTNSPWPVRFLLPIPPLAWLRGFHRPPRCRLRFETSQVESILEIDVVVTATTTI